MFPPNQPVPQISPPNRDARDHELEWLLCLASAYKSSRQQVPATFEAADKPLQSKSAGVRAKTESHLSAWQFALRKIQRWRRPGSNRIDAA